MTTTMTRLPISPSNDVWKRYTILIVDDESFVLDELYRVLTHEGFSVAKARSGEEGLQLLSEVSPQLVIADQKMPAGMSGTEFLAQVKARHPDMMTMILSAYSEPDYLLDAVNEAGVYQYVLKPWDETDLVARVSQALQFSHAQVERRRLAEANARLLKNMTQREYFSLMGEFSAAMYDRFFPVLEASLHAERHKLNQFTKRSFLSASEEGFSHLGIVISRFGQVGNMYQQPSHFRRLPIEPLVHGCVKEAQDAVKPLGLSVEWKEDYAPNLPHLLIQPTVLSYAIKALLENAVIFNVRKTIDSPRLVSVTVSFMAEPEPLVRIQVQDNGPGVDPFEQDKIFFPLYSTCLPKTAPRIQPYSLSEYNLGIYHHMGLGLFIARWGLIQHHGNVELTSSSESGSVFQAEIPIDPSDLAVKM